MKNVSFFVIAFSAFLGGCASVDFEYPKTETTALTDTDNTLLGQGISPFVANHLEDESGFLLQLDGIDALAMRLLLTQRAERSIDTQYYLINGDAVGYVFIYSLLQAADRGVRVRLLVDDILSKGYDTGMAALDSHPSFEVRVFNPFAGRSFRIGDFITGFSRVNRRMHNKSFTVDNQVTIIGGRNIASEYFGARNDVNFSDVDVIGIGPVVQDVSNSFDLYWNNELAAPVPAFAKMPDDPAAELERMRTRLEVEIAKIKESKYSDAVRADYENFLDKSKDEKEELFTWAPYKLAYDAPEKAHKDKAKDAKSIITTLKAAIDNAKRELIIISPYFVPGKRGIEYFKELRERGLEVTVITNSLSSNNHAIVHSGYAPYRKSLLELGVKLYEVRADRSALGVERAEGKNSDGNLHTKAFVVDREKLFVGSFNWDPRSIDINTEMGVIIESPVLASLTAKQIDEALNHKVYEVYLDENQKLRWADNSGAEAVIYTKEPNTSWWTRFKTSFMKILPVESQL